MGNFEDKFKDKFNDWDVPAPQWADFQVSMSTEKKSAKYRFWWFFLMLFLLVSVGSWSVYKFLLPSKNEMAVTKQNLPTQTNKQNASVLPENSPTQTKENNPITNNQQPTTNNPQLTTNKEQLIILPTQTKENEPTTNNPQLTTNKEQLIILPTQTKENEPTTNNQQPTTKNEQLIILPTQTKENEPTTKNEQPTTKNEQLIILPTQTKENEPTTNNEQRTTNNQQPIPSTRYQNKDIQSLLYLVYKPYLPYQVGEANFVAKKVDSMAVPSPKRLSRWGIQGFIGQTHSYKIVTPNREDDILIKYFQADSGFKALNRGFEAGFRVEKDWKKGIRFYAGLAYEQAHLQTNYVYFSKPTEFRIDSVFARQVYFTPLVQDSMRKERFITHSLRAEIGAGYGVRLGRFEPSVNIGVGYQGILNSYFQNENLRKRAQTQTHLFSLSAGMQASYWLSSRRQVFVEPHLTYNLSNTFRGGMFLMRTYQASLRVGMKWRLP